MFEKIQDRAVNRWADILPALGVSQSFLTGKHGACPWCSGTDRFRYDNRNGSGSFICSRCGSGSGVDFVMKFLNVDFITARKEIEKHLGLARVSIPAAASSDGDPQIKMKSAWQRCCVLTGADPASRYLISRGLELAQWPSQIRYAPDISYVHDDKSRSSHPAMVAKFVSPDALAMTLHMTFLDAQGNKADVPKVRKLAACKVPPGGAVRLAPSAETMGIAEGIETSLAASLLDGIPVWAALSAANLVKWVPPANAKHVIIYGDNDASLTGHHAAYSLGYRLKTEGLSVDVRIPVNEGSDWHDEWAALGGATPLWKSGKSA